MARIFQCHLSIGLFFTCLWLFGSPGAVSATLILPGSLLSDDFTLDSKNRKWGDPTLGTPGAVSFSVMPAGSTMERPPLPNEGLSTDFFTLFAGDELAAVLDAFSVWAAVTNLVNLGVISDNGADFNASPADPRGVAGPFGDIRLAAADIPKAGVLAHAYFPPVNGTSASGDVHFDNTVLWIDDPADTSADPDIDFFTVALHELGHSLGLDHSDVLGSVMEPVYAGARRMLHADDIAGIQTIYGVSISAIGEPTPLLLLAVGLAGLVARRHWRDCTARRRS